MCFWLFKRASKLICIQWRICQLDAGGTKLGKNFITVLLLSNLPEASESPRQSYWRREKTEKTNWALKASLRSWRAITYARGLFYGLFTCMGLFSRRGRHRENFSIWTFLGTHLEPLHPYPLSTPPEKFSQIHSCLHLWFHSSLLQRIWTDPCLF